MLLTTSLDGTMKLWALSTMKPIHTFDVDTSLTWVGFDIQDRMIISKYSNGEFKATFLPDKNIICNFLLQHIINRWKWILPLL